MVNPKDRKTRGTHYSDKESRPRREIKRINHCGFLSVEWEYAMAYEIRCKESTRVRWGNLAIILGKKMKPSNERHHEEKRIQRKM